MTFGLKYIEKIDQIDDVFIEKKKNLSHATTVVLQRLGKIIQRGNKTELILVKNRL